MCTGLIWFSLICCFPCFSSSDDHNPTAGRVLKQCRASRDTHTGNCFLMVSRPTLFHFNLLSKGNSRSSGYKWTCDESSAASNLITQSWGMYSLWLLFSNAIFLSCLVFVCLCETHLKSPTTCWIDSCVSLLWVMMGLQRIHTFKFRERIPDVIWNCRLRGYGAAESIAFRRTDPPSFWRIIKWFCFSYLHEIKLSFY